MKTAAIRAPLIAVVLAIAGIAISPGFGALAADIAQLTENCENCHGVDGVSSEPEVPTIAGMSAYFLIDTMAIYKDRDRPCVEAEYPDGEKQGEKTDMCKIADDISDGDGEALAKYFAGKTYVLASQAFDAGKAASGRQVHEDACEKCHEAGGSVAEDDAGFLAGQWTPYLRQVFDAYVADQRSMPKKMKPKFDELSAEDRENLLHYYASLQ